jgi:hypothetical protein
MTSLQASLIRLTSRPLAIAPRALETLLAVGRVAIMPEGSAGTRRRGYAVADAGIAVVPVLGPLVARGDWLTETKVTSCASNTSTSLAKSISARDSRSIL